MTRIIELPIPEELRRRVDERAKTAGIPREAHIRAVLSKDLSSEASVSEILAPLRDQVTGSGISDEELDRLFCQAPISLIVSDVRIESISVDRTQIRAVFRGPSLEGTAVSRRDARETSGGEAAPGC